MLASLPVALLALGANAAPPKARDDAACHFYDGHGDVNCDWFSIVFGDPHSSDTPVRKIVITTYNASVGYQDMVNTWQASFSCPTGSSGGGDPASVVWEDFKSASTHTKSDLQLHGGHMCTGTMNEGEKYDNMWLRYPADTGPVYDIPSDGHCGKVGNLNLARRCLIPM